MQFIICKLSACFHVWVCNFSDFIAIDFWAEPWNFLWPTKEIIRIPSQTYRIDRVTHEQILVKNRKSIDRSQFLGLIFCSGLDADEQGRKFPVTNDDDHYHFIWFKCLSMTFLLVVYDCYSVCMNTRMMNECLMVHFNNKMLIHSWARREGKSDRLQIVYNFVHNVIRESNACIQFFLAHEMKYSTNWEKTMLLTHIIVHARWWWFSLSSSLFLSLSFFLVSSSLGDDVCLIFKPTNA